MEIMLNKSSKNRSFVVKKNIVLSLFYRLLIIALNIVAVPITLGYLGEEKYGVWATLLSLLTWFNLFNAGFSSGLRNKLAESIALDRLDVARLYISTTYIVITALSLIAAILIFLVNTFLIKQWNEIFNTSLIPNWQISAAVTILSLSVIFSICLSVSTQIASANHETSLLHLRQLLANAFFAIAIYVFSILNIGNLLWTSIAYGLSVIVSHVLKTFFVFFKYSEQWPRKIAFERAKAKDVLGLGWKFFIIQISVLIVSSTDNLIVSKVLGPEHVTGYSIAMQLFLLVIMLGNLAQGPLWSAYTDAYTKGDLAWMKLVIKRLMMSTILVLIVNSVLFLFSDKIVMLWTGSTDILVDPLLFFLMAVFSVITYWNGIYNNVLGGIGKIRLGVFSTSVAGVVNIPLSIYFAKTMHSSSGVILATIISISISSFLSPLQVYYFIFSKKRRKVFDMLLS